MKLISAPSVQSAVLPLLLAPSARHRRLFPFPLQDLCINAPTGSGKTLSYVIPIIDLLYSRYTKTKAPRRLRALVILPTKDLVQQLKETFDSLIFGTDLKVRFPFDRSAKHTWLMSRPGRNSDGSLGFFQRAAKGLHAEWNLVRFFFGRALVKPHP